MSAKIKKDPRISKQQRMIIDIFHTSQWLDDRMSKVLKEYGLTHPQFNVVKILQSAYPEPLTLKEIKESIMFTKSDVTRMVDRLVSKGFIERNICPVNRRQVDIIITAKGSETIDKIMEDFEDKVNLRIQELISVEEALKTSEILRRIRE